MIIEKIFPAVVTAKSTLIKCLFSEGAARGLSNEEIKAIISIVPKTLIEACTFLDKLTGLWRYEFGVPYDIAENLVWGTHMWVPVESLFTALFFAHARIPINKKTTYLVELADPNKHQNRLVEMIPIAKLSSKTPVVFDVSGLGAGNLTVDWVIGPQDGRIVLLDVKRRTIDFIKHTERIDTANSVPEPSHDPKLLFRSVEQKFLPADPDLQLQGAWIVTDMMQEENQLVQAFTTLDSSKVHFVVFGDWGSDVFVMSRRDIDRQFLLKLFCIYSSNRFIFQKSGESIDIQPTGISA
jgi:hypothetical protein